MNDKRGPLHERILNNQEPGKDKVMSDSTEQSTEAKTSRVQVGNLPQQERDLKDQEAENIKGGGGRIGSVIGSHIGEEIPQ